MGAIVTMETGLCPLGFLVLLAKEFGNGLRILRVTFSEIARKINKAHKLSREGTERKSRKKGMSWGLRKKTGSTTEASTQQCGGGVASQEEGESLEF